MIGTPPSLRPMWHDPAAHAQDFAERYSTPLSYAAEQRMTELGIHHDRIGMPDEAHGILWSAFHPQGRVGGVTRRMAASSSIRGCSTQTC